MTQWLTVNAIPESASAGEESYEIHWTIPGWRQVRRSEGLVSCQVGVFETSCSESFWFKTKWLVGLKLVTSGDSRRMARLYWKLLEIQGSQSTSLEVKLETQLLNAGNHSPKYSDETSQEVKLLETVEGTTDCLQVRPDVYSTDEDLICPLGTIQFCFKLTIKPPTTCFWEYLFYRMDQFSKKSKDQLNRDLVEPLNSYPGDSDLTFITSDEVEISGHKSILRARCSVFEAMLNCDLTEKSTGIIRMTDISAKTMRILMHYFYTGELRPSWRDPGTIVEFTYAAGKYQLTGVLELLDDMLGRSPEGGASNLDVQLISLAAKLQLEKAEKRLLERIIDKIKMVKTGDEIFKLFGFEEEEVVGGKGMIMLAKSRKEKLGKMEDLLKCFAERANLVKTAEELFELFGRGKEWGNRE